MRKWKRKLLKLGLILSRVFHSKSYMRIFNSYLRTCGMDISGNIKYIHSSSYLDIAYASKIHIGNNCVFSVKTVVLAHDYSLECGLGAIGLGDLSNEKRIVRDVYIGQNVFVGAGCIILPGTHIGDNCIIGAGTVCSGVIPNDSVVVGGKWKVISRTTEWAREKLRQEVGLFFENEEQFTMAEDE